MKFCFFIIFSFTINLVACTSSAKLSSKIAFQKEIGTQRLIVLADNDGTNQTVISNPAEDTYHPDLSPSGQFLAYSRGKIQPGGQTQLEVVIQDLKNNITEVWTPKANQFIHVEFSGNEKYLVFSGPNPKNLKQNIYVVDLEKERALGPASIQTVKNQTTHIFNPKYEIIESPFDCYAPAVSSDGSTIIYHRTENKSDKKAPKQLISYNRSTQTELELTLKDEHAMFPSLSPDDHFVAFVSQDGGQWDIFVVDLWTLKKIQVTNDVEMEFTPTFKSNNEIYFTRFTDNLNGNSNEITSSNPLIDIYSIRDLDFKNFIPNASAPTAFLNDAASSEYVVSFSNSEDLNKTVLSSLPKPERSSFGAVTYNDTIYIAGGHQGPEHTYPKESFLNLLQAYTIKSKTWVTLKPMNEAKHGFQIAAYNNFIYVFGGFTFSAVHKPKWKSVNTIERYDIKTNQWQILPVKLLSPRSSNALAVVNDKVYLIGGWDSTPQFESDKNGRFHSSIEVFDLKSETVSILPTTLPAPLRRAFTAVSVNNEIYLMGGIGQGVSHFDWIDNVTVLNTKNLSWSEKARLPFATFAPGAGIINNKIYLIGGMILKDEANNDLDYVDDVYSFDINKNKWSHTGVYLSKNKGFPQVVEFMNQSLGILGGHTYLQTPKGLIDHPVTDFEVIELNNTN